MPWISAAAARNDLRKAARNHLQDQASGAAPRTVDSMTITYAFIGGEADVMAMAADHAEQMLPIMEKRLELNNASQTADYLNLAVAASHENANIQPRLEHLLKAKPDKDPITAALRWIAASLLGRSEEPPRLRNAPDWLTALVKAAPADALDLALTPDHEDWDELRVFVLPLALRLASQTGTAMETHAQHGGHPERRGQVLYDRTYPRPLVSVAVNEQDPATWPGFDAIERKDERLIAYHYLNQRWQAPIAFQPELDAVPFLRHIPLSWKLVQSSVSAETWESIREDVEARRETHVLAHDPKRAPVAEGALENASRELGITLLAEDYRSI